jgi:GNAT superfamily N-acetyltransferase
VDDCISVHYPERRILRDLNALWPVSAPTPEDIPRLLEIRAGEFEGTGVAARIPCREEPGAEEPQDSPWATGDGHRDFSLSRLEVPQCSAPREPELTGDFELRRVEGDDDWQAVVDVNVACHGFAPGPKADFCRWTIGERHRAAYESGRASWWAAWSGGTAVAAAGVYDGKGLPARLQEVVTHREHRRRGACTRLLSAVLARAGPEGALLVAEAGSDAHRIYSRLGFEPVSRVRELFQRLG